MKLWEAPLLTSTWMVIPCNYPFHFKFFEDWVGVLTRPPWSWEPGILLSSSAFSFSVFVFVGANSTPSSWSWWTYDAREFHEPENRSLLGSTTHEDLFLKMLEVSLSLSNGKNLWVGRAAQLVEWVFIDRGITNRRLIWNYCQVIWAFLFCDPVHHHALNPILIFLKRIVVLFLNVV